MEEPIEIGEDGLPMGPKAIGIQADGGRTIYFWDGSKLINDTLIVESHEFYPYADGDSFRRPESLPGW